MVIGNHKDATSAQDAVSSVTKHIPPGGEDLGEIRRRQFRRGIATEGGFPNPHVELGQ